MTFARRCFSSIFCLLCCPFFLQKTTAQPSAFAIEWQDVHADFGFNQLSDALADPGGGWVACGWITVNNIPEAWVGKWNADGQPAWQLQFGDPLGQAIDFAEALSPVPGGGYVATGMSSHQNTGQGFQVWLAKIAGDGALVWEKNYGGSLGDNPADVLALPDGSFVVAASTASTDGDLAGLSIKGMNDLWIFKLDPDGNLLWQQTYGSSNADVPVEIAPAPGGGFWLLARTSGFDFDVPNSFGGQDAWLLRLDETGALLGSQVFGSSSEDRVEPGSLAVSADGKPALALRFDAPDGNNPAAATGLVWLQLDAGGSPLFHQHFPGQFLSARTPLAAAAGGGYWLSQEQLGLLRLDPAGVVQWQVDSFHLHGARWLPAALSDESGEGLIFYSTRTLGGVPSHGGWARFGAGGNLSEQKEWAAASALRFNGLYLLDGGEDVLSYGGNFLLQNRLGDGDRVWTSSGQSASGSLDSGSGDFFVWENRVGFARISRRTIAGQLMWEKDFQAAAVAAGTLHLKPGGDLCYLLKLPADQTAVVRLHPDGSLVWQSPQAASQPFSHLRALPDGGSLLTGTSATGGFWRKLDEAGNPVWDKNFPAGSANLLEADSASGSVTLGGTTADGSFLRKYGEAGEVIWEQNFPGIRGGFIAVPGGFLALQSLPNFQLRLRKHDPGGNLIFDKLVKTLGEQISPVASRLGDSLLVCHVPATFFQDDLQIVVATAGGQVTFEKLVSQMPYGLGMHLPAPGGGWLSSASNIIQTQLYRLAADGSLMYEFFYTEFGVRAMMPTADQGAFLVGNSISSGSLMPCMKKVLPDGTVSFSEELPGVNVRLSASQASSPGYFFGEIEQANCPLPLPCPADGWLLKIDSLGNVLWRDTLGGSRWDGILNAVETPADTGLILLGTTASTDGDLSGMPVFGQSAWLVKMKLPPPSAVAEPSLAAGSMRIAPNPVFGDRLQFFTSLPQAQSGILSVLNGHGQVFYRQKTTLPGGDFQAELKLPDLPAGLYFLEFQAAEGRLAGKWMKAD